jgi:hypothetical protein
VWSIDPDLKLHSSFGPAVLVLQHQSEHEMGTLQEVRFQAREPPSPTRPTVHTLKRNAAFSFDMGTAQSLKSTYNPRHCGPIAE